MHSIAVSMQTLGIRIHIMHTCAACIRVAGCVLMSVECSSNIKVLTTLAPRLHMYGCPSSVSPEAPCSRPQSPRMKILCRPHGLHLSGRPGSCNIPKHDCVRVHMYVR